MLFFSLRNNGCDFQTLASAVDSHERQVRRRHVLRRVGNNQWIAVAYHTVSAASADAVPLQALSEAMIVTPAGRLYKYTGRHT